MYTIFVAKSLTEAKCVGKLLVTMDSYNVHNMCSQKFDRGLMCR